MKSNSKVETENKMNKLLKNDSKVQKVYNDKINLANSANHRCTDSNCTKNDSNDQNYFEKIGIRNQHPWNLIGLR